MSHRSIAFRYNYDFFMTLPLKSIFAGSCCLHLGMSLSREPFARWVVEIIATKLMDSNMKTIVLQMRVVRGTSVCSAYFLPNMDRMSPAPAAAFAFLPDPLVFFAGFSDAPVPGFCVSGWGRLACVASCLTGAALTALAFFAIATCIPAVLQYSTSTKYDKVRAS